jgi:hypothetical protein
MLLEKSFAAVALLVCVLLLVRGALRPQQRQQWDSAVRRAGHSTRALGQTLGQGLAQRWRLLAGRRGAAQEAQQAIERARRAGNKPKGGDNVVRPSAFDPSRRRDDKLH